MWIEELPNGKYKYVERYTDPITGKRRRVSATHTKNTKKVQQEMLLYLHERIDKIVSERSDETNYKMTFREVADEWYSFHKYNIKYNTRKIYKHAIYDFNKYFGDILIENITSGMINKYILKQLELNYKSSSMKIKVVAIKLVFRYAYQNGYIETRVDDKITVPKIEKENIGSDNKKKYLEKDELNLLIQQLIELGDKEITRYASIQVLTGMRAGELSAIDYKKHINFENKTILIERTLIRSSDVFNSPKNGKKRIIHLSEKVLEIISEQIVYQKEKNKVYNNENTLLFTNENNKPLSIGSVNYRLKKVPAGENISTHIFRHTFITRMVEAGVDRNLIARQVGHSNTDMIDKIYSHFTETMDQKLKEAINLVDIF